MKKKIYNYFVYADGRIYSINRKIFLKPETTKEGYSRVALCNNGITKKYFVHRLVAHLFLKEKNGSLFVNHIDGNKKNNHASNLEWCTRSENQKHAYLNGLQPKIASWLNKNSFFNEFDCLVCATFLPIFKPLCLIKNGYPKRAVYGFSDGTKYKDFPRCSKKEIENIKMIVA